ncbi:c-type cytochrome [Sagittula salina]|uniref:Cytochrome c n=1 Tax=Sagittula salina TaxID=2820268 RepID=A0A940S4B4_9RHOB|nr:cytochrome c [Sagittula salina]MBP0483695.1 cytochrome c [Sagittula salina]
MPLKRLVPLILVVGASIAAVAALAHSGVSNPAVLPRMEAMKRMGDQMKVLGTMAKGQAPFDAGSAQDAVDRIRKRAAEVPELFRAQEMDPKSEALPTIWESYGDFTVKAEELQGVADVRIAAKEDLGQAVAELGAACKACHAHYRD